MFHLLPKTQKTKKNPKRTSGFVGRYLIFKIFFENHEQFFHHLKIYNTMKKKIHCIINCQLKIGAILPYTS
jgi:hypothetical protein